MAAEASWSILAASVSFENMADTTTERDARKDPLSAGQLFVLAAFVVSRILYWRAGLRFDASPVDNYWQYIDPVLMKTRLLESLFYLHMQPPGFNLAIGLVVKLFPVSYGTVLQIIYLILGAAIALCLLHLMTLFHVCAQLAALLTALFIVNPGCVLYENFAIYEYPIAFLLLAAAIALFRLCQSPNVLRSLSFFGILFGLAMIRNIFHILFILLIAAALGFHLPKARRIVLAGAVPVLVLMLALQTKNWVLFRSFTTSTWAGMATGVVTTFQLTPEETSRLIRQGVISPIAAFQPFSALPLYAPFLRPVPPSGIPVLDQTETSTGHPNYNNPAYLQAHEMYFDNAEVHLAALSGCVPPLGCNRLVRVLSADQRVAFVRCCATDAPAVRPDLQCRRVWSVPSDGHAEGFTRNPRFGRSAAAAVLHGCVSAGRIADAHNLDIIPVPATLPGPVEFGRASRSGFYDPHDSVFHCRLELAIHLRKQSVSVPARWILHGDCGARHHFGSGPTALRKVDGCRAAARCVKYQRSVSSNVCPVQAKFAISTPGG